MLLSLTTTMAALTSRADQQYRSYGLLTLGTSIFFLCAVECLVLAAGWQFLGQSYERRSG